MGKGLVRLVENQQECGELTMCIRILWVDANGVCQERLRESVVPEDSSDPAEVVKNGSVPRVSFEDAGEKSRGFAVATVVQGCDRVGDVGRVLHDGFRSLSVLVAVSSIKTPSDEGGGAAELG